MERDGSKRIVVSLLSAVAAGAIILGIRYIRNVVIDKSEFSPNWIEVIFLVVVVGVMTFIGPDAAQRRRNRQELKNRFTK